MSEITPHRFEDSVRSDLRYKHGLEHKDLERVSGIFNDTLKEIDAKSLNASHFDTALKEMKKHADWEHLAPHHQEALSSVLKSHLGIQEPS